MNLKSWILNVAMVVLLAMTGYMWRGLDCRLQAIEERLRGVELSQTRIMTMLGLNTAHTGDTDTTLRGELASISCSVHTGQK